MSTVAANATRSPGAGIAAFGLALLAAGASCVAPVHAARSAPPADQPLVELLGDHVARTGPSSQAPRIESVAARRPLTHVRTALPILDSASSPTTGSWVQVRLPGRPNEHTGWISADRTRLTSTGWSIALRLSTRRVTIYHRGRVKRRFAAVIGTPSTPTPTGTFFVEEAVALSGKAGGPFALATSARSEVLQEFAGGPGQIALHGTAGLAGAPGSAASHGCVRLSTHAITWLSRRIGGGAPLTITR